MPKLHVHRLTDYFLANTDTAYLAKYQCCRIGYLAELHWENTIWHREQKFSCFFGIRSAKDVDGSPSALARVYIPTLTYVAFYTGRNNIVRGWLYAVGCRRVIIDREGSVYHRHKFMSHSGQLAQCSHGTSLSSVVLIAWVRTLALCWTRRTTIAYKYHGSLLSSLQSTTNITDFCCRWF